MATFRIPGLRASGSAITAIGSVVLAASAAIASPYSDINRAAKAGPMALSDEMHRWLCQPKCTGQ